MASVAVAGVDYAIGRPTPAQLVAAGVRFVGRYLATIPGDRRALTASEAAGYLAAGLSIVLLWETTPDRAAGGAAAGIADATAARAQLAAIGAPSSAAVYFVVQDDGTPPSLSAIDAYLTGAGSVLGAARIGAYAGGTVLAHIKAAGTARYLWRAAAISWGSAPAGTHIIQTATASTIPPAGTIGGQAVDRDTAFGADYGQWRADVMGVRVMQDATISSSAPWSAFSTARTAKACRSNALGTGVQQSFGVGVDLGVVQRGRLVAALGPWPAGTPVVVTNVNGEAAAFIAAEVTTTPIAPPVPPAPPTQTVTVSGQNLKTGGPA